MERVKQLVKLSDFFNSFQMLRFNKETEYRTFTGGIVSIGVIITIIIAFASMIENTINRSTISYTYNQQKGQDPPLSLLTTSAESKFMFAVEVEGYNLNSQNRIFDVFFSQVESQFNQNTTYTNIPAQACTKQHWAMLPKIYDHFDSINAAYWLCPKIGSVLKIQGKYSSNIMNRLQIAIYPCSNSTDPTRPCASQQQIDEYFNPNGTNGTWSFFDLYYINSVINADQPEYITYYLQDRNYIAFNKDAGANMDIYVTEISVTSDNSIWPFTEISKDSVFYIPFAPIIYPTTVQGTYFYAQFSLMKDYSSQFYQREVQKIFVVFSFMGGLIGAIMACLFIIHTYTSFAFELALALQVFKGEKDCKTFKREFFQGSFSLNILHFFKYLSFQLLRKLRPALKSPLYEHISECRDEILSQLDIKNLIKRIIFLEYSISFIFEDYQLAEMHQKKPTLPQEVKKLRSKIQSQFPTKDEVQDETNKHLKGEFCKKAQLGEEQNIPNILQPNIILENSSSGFRDQLSLKNGNKVQIYQQNSHNLRVKRENIKRLKQSAKGGNIVSQKILHIINSQNNRVNFQQTQKQSEN